MFKEQKEYQCVCIKLIKVESGMYKNILAKVQWIDIFLCGGGHGEGGEDMRAQCNEPRSPKLCCDSTCSYCLRLISDCRERKMLCIIGAGLTWVLLMVRSGPIGMVFTMSRDGIWSYQFMLLGCTLSYFGSYPISLKRKLQCKNPTHSWKVLDIKNFRAISNCYN